MLAGVGASVFSFAYGYFLGGFTVFSTGYVLLMLGIRIVSGAMLAGVGGKVVVDGLLATGSLRGYAITRSDKGEARA